MQYRSVSGYSGDLVDEPGGCVAAAVSMPVAAVCVMIWIQGLKVNDNQGQMGLCSCNQSLCGKALAQHQAAGAVCHVLAGYRLLVGKCHPAHLGVLQQGELHNLRTHCGCRAVGRGRPVGHPKQHRGHLWGSPANLHGILWGCRGLQAAVLYRVLVGQL